MKKKSFNRREFIAAFAAAIAVAENADAQDFCSVSRTTTGSLPTKSYSCYVDSDATLNVAFMRLSDLMFYVAKTGALPSGLPSTIEHTGFLENQTLRVLEQLFDEFSYAFDFSWPRYSFDGRDGNQVAKDLYSGDRPNSNPITCRTLGVWSSPDSLPTFPLPEELRNLVVPAPDGLPQEVQFIRHATRTDFENLEAKLDEYLEILREKLGSHEGSVDFYTSDGDTNYLPLSRQLSTLGHIPLMRHIDAGSVNNFLPIFSVNQSGECGDVIAGFGIYYNPAALYVDVAVFENTGSRAITVDNVFGARNDNFQLRRYSSSTPSGSQPLDIDSFDLAPGERRIFVQRLLFRTVKSELFELPSSNSSPAEYGPTELPKGVVVEGKEIAFDGRSHNAMILSSNVPLYCCPFLEYWDPDHLVWVNVGTILEEAVGESNVQLQYVQLDKFRARFRISEMEHERTILNSVSLVMHMTDGKRFEIPLADNINGAKISWPLSLDVSESLEFGFSLPEHYSNEDVLTCFLVVNGYYDRYSDLASANGVGYDLHTL